MSYPTDPAAQLQYLMNRAAIGDRILTFARAIDENDTNAYADCFAKNGALTLPHIQLQGQDKIRAMTHQKGNHASLHISTNHQIDFHGDTATIRACVIATHVFDKSVPTDNATAGGWYDIEAVMENGEWKFASVSLTVAWTTGQMIR